MNKTDEFFKTIFFKEIEECTQPFIVKNNFKIGSGEITEVEIAFINENFKKWFGKTIEEQRPKGTLFIGKLKGKTRESFMSEEEINKPVFFSDIFDKLKKQPNGEKGELITKRFTFKTNIFFVGLKKGSGETACFVFVTWNKDGWNIVAKEIDFFSYKKKLAKGSLIFYRR